jgi:hypothetical protein
MATPGATHNRPHPPDLDDNIPEELLPLTAYTGDITRSARAAANDLGQERNSDNVNRTRGFVGFLNRVVRGSMFKEAFENRYADQELADMREQGGIGRNQQELQRNAQAIEQRILDETGAFLRENEDANNKFMAENDPNFVAARNLIRDFALGAMGNEDFQQRSYEIQTRIHAGNEHGRDELFAADNWLEIAEAARAGVQQGHDINQVLNGFRLARMETHVGQNTEARLGRVDRVVERLMKSPVGRWIPSTVLGFGVNVALNMVVPAAKWTLMAGGVAVTGGVGLAVGAGVAGVAAGAKERIRIKDDRDRFIRDNTAGRMRPSLQETQDMYDEWLAAGVDRNGNPFTQAQYDAAMVNAQRADRQHQRLLATQYEQVGIFDMQNGLNAQIDIMRGRPTAQQIQAAIGALGAADERVSLGDSGDMDLINYTGAESIDQEWNNLAIIRCELRRALDEAIANADPAVVAAVWNNAGNQTVDYEVGLARDLERTRLYTAQGGIDQVDAEFRRQRRTSSILAGVRGAGITAGAGFLAQEVSGFFTDKTNLFEEIQARASGHPELVNGTTRTLGAGIYDSVNGFADTTTTFEAASDTMTSIDLDSGGNISISDDLHIEGDPDTGLFSILDKNDNVIADNISVDPDTGQFDANSIAALKAAGVFSESHFTTNTTIEGSAKVGRTLVERYDDHIVRVNSTTILNNGTPKIYDYNEQGGRIASDYSAGDTFTKDGSWTSGGGHVDMTAPPDNTLDIAIPKAEAFPDGVPAEYDLNPDGDFIHLHFSYGEPLPPEIQQNLEPIYRNGSLHHWETHLPGYLAWEQYDASSGHADIAASIRGDQPPKIDEILTHYNTSFTGPGYEVVTESQINAEAPVMIPIEWRRPLGDYAESRRHINPYGGYYGFNRDRSYEAIREEYDRIKPTISPRLREDPRAKLKLGEEADYYRDRLVRETSPEYSSSIDKTVSKTPELASLSDEVKSITIIPVHATAESDRVFGTVSLYARQNNVDPGSNVLALYLNYKASESEDPSNILKIAKTKAEIERARRAFPDMKIAVFEHANTAEEVGTKDDPKLTQSISRRMFDTVLTSIHKAIDAGRMSDDHDILIIRNDADENGMDRNYIANMQKAAEQNETVDMFTGTTRFETNSYVKTPGFGIVTNFMQAINAISKRYGRVHTAGANFAIRASTYAAIGGIGFGDEYGGAGADDVAMGYRTQTARTGDSPAGSQNGYQSGGRFNIQPIKVAKRVSGTTIDTSSDRYMAPYLRGKPIYTAYDAYGFGGNRSEGLPDPSKHSEYGIGNRLNLNLVAKRIEISVSDMISQENQEVTRPDGETTMGKLAVPFFFPKQAYRMAERPDGKVEFKFTNWGKRWLGKQIKRGDGYGKRKQQALYDRRNINGRRLESRMIKA